MKLRKILKSMFNNYCKTFKDVPPAICSDNKKPAPAGFFVS
ncbi:TPA: stress response protein AzuC [Escherichia coli]|nr:stress response protein AzuC [Escherichia coli]